MSIFWNVWIIGLTSLCLALVLWVLLANRKVAQDDTKDPDNKTTGHVYDGIEEYDNPLPKWWFMLFIGTFIFGIGYLTLYPGLGSWQGVLGRDNLKELEIDQAAAAEQYAAAFGEYNAMAIEDLALDPRAMKSASRVFLNNCAICHSSDGGGNYGIPNLTDNDWLYGGSPEKIYETLINGRQANMPAWAALGDAKINQLAHYVMSISYNARTDTQKENEQYQFDENLALQGKALFTQNCVACHGADGKGSQALGAPNLTDNIWLYNDTIAGTRSTLRSGRNGVMPKQGDKLRDEKIHLLTAYVYSLSLADSKAPTLK